MDVLQTEQDPIGALLKATPLGQKIDLTDPRVRHAISHAMQELGDCADTMALLAQRLGLGEGASYQYIRSQFSHGYSPEG